MTFTKVAIAGFLALLGFLCWLAVSGFGAARELLISLFALVLLVGGGNLLAGRSGAYGRGRSHGRSRSGGNAAYGRSGPAGAPAAPAPPDHAASEPGDEVDAARSNEPAP